jgi:hypothetical protein
VAWAGLTEEIERQEREDNARGPEPEDVVTRTLLPGKTSSEDRSVVLELSPGCALGADELRVRAWLRARLAGGC